MSPTANNAPAGAQQSAPQPAGLLCRDGPAAPAQQALAERLGLALLDHPPPAGDLYLELAADGLALRLAGPGAPGPVRSEFASGAGAWRRHRGGGELLVRACGLKGRADFPVVDATAGLGRDAFVLAAHGARVTLLERSALVAELLADGLRRAREAGGAAAATAGRMTVVQADARQWLAARQAPVVYLDPMYPGGPRRASPGKTMQMLQRLLGEEPDPAELLHAARPAATERVVVKRPRRAPPLADTAPHHSLDGRSTRFDVYLPG